MDAVPGFRATAVLYQSNRITVYRAVSDDDGRPVILKVLRDGMRRAGELARHRHEHDIVRRITNQGVVVACQAQLPESTPVLVFEDIGGESLKTLFTSRRFTLKECLEIGVKAADALAAIHLAGVIHKDVNPSNVVLDPATGTVQIIDFGLSTLFAREQPEPGNPERLEGTLRYISPEQTGRMNRSVDHRTDLYSFGATLYELLTGRLPFVDDDPLTLVHAHLAKTPEPASSVDTSVPEAVSAIVAKLMAKTPEARYQSAHGVRRDLQECLEQLQASGTIEPFELGRFDASDTLTRSQRLYGRESDVQKLLAVFERAAEGQPGVVMVTGHPGIGKSSLVRELYRPVTGRRGYFLSGKFDQLQRGVPYRALVDAFQELTRQLLGENEARLAKWKDALLASLGSNGQIIVDLIPEMQLIIGPQPALAALEPLQEQNRFNLVLASFMRVFCRPEHPLTLYLDDLQWIDPASLALLGHLLGDPSIRHFLFVGAYRDNEMDALHPLAGLLQRLAKSGTDVHTLTLHPLGAEHVRQLLADALSMAPQDVAPLAEVIFKKTGGNPFFTEEFIKSIHSNGLLTFRHGDRTWCWDLGSIDAAGSTDNVVDLMVANLRRLDPKSLEVLQLAACIGHRFRLSTLETIHGGPAQDTLAALRAAIAAELVVPVGATPAQLGGALVAADFECRFAHDRIQYAAYSLIPQSERQAIHLAIGRLLLRGLSEENRQERLFEMVNHLNLGVDMLLEEAEKHRLIELNQEAARKARRSNAHDAALGYLQAALALLGDDGWERVYDLALALHTEAAQAAFLARRMPESDQLVDKVIAQGRTLLHKIDAYAVKMQSLIAAARWRDAAGLGFEVLKGLGVSFPRRPNRVIVLSRYLRLRLLLLGRSKESLRNAPLMSDPRRLAEMHILPYLVTAVYFALPAFSPLVIIRAVEISVRYGNAPYSAFAYASYGSLLCSGMGRMVQGREFGELALSVLERLNATGSKAKVMNLVQSHINHWSGALRDSLEPLREGFDAGIANGDLEYASLCGIVHVYTAFHSGLPLATVEELAQHYARVARGGSRGSIMLRRQLALNLLGHSEDPCVLRGSACDEDTLLPRLLESNQVMGLLTYHTAKAALAFLFERQEQALHHSNEARKYQKSSIGIATVPPQIYLQALITLSLCPGLDSAAQASALKGVDRGLARLRAWARHAPMNHLHRVHLLEAERCRVLGQAAQAGELYDVAIADARRDQYLIEEALANELAGRFYLGRERRQLAHGYLREAREVYARWGAVAKVRQMESRYPHLMDTSSSLDQSLTAASTVVSGSFSMDLKALMRALKDIGSEQVHTRLLEKTITTAMEVAGAQSALLFLRGEDDELVLEAEVSVRDDKPQLMKSVPLADCANVSAAVINYARRTLQTVVIHDAQEPQSVIPGLSDDTYIKAHAVRSILCVPLLTGPSETPELSGLLYLENNATSHTFVERVREPLEIICLSASGRLELSRKAVTDLLTNLYNHDYMQGILAKETSAAARSGRTLSLIMIDIDHFKNFNDEHGHQAGDRVLSEVAALIKNSTRQSDVVARYGGEEIAVVLPDADQNVAFEAAERIRSAIEAAVVPYEQELLSVTASLGVATYGPQTCDPASLVKAADQALYRSKHDGRNRVTIA